MESHQAFEAYLKGAKPGKTIATLAEAEWCDKAIYEEFAGHLFSTPISPGRKNAGEPYSAGSITNYVQTILNLGAAKHKATGSDATKLFLRPPWPLMHKLLSCREQATGTTME